MHVYIYIERERDNSHYMMLCTSLSCDTTPIHCTPLPLHSLLYTNAVIVAICSPYPHFVPLWPYTLSTLQSKYGKM